MLEWRQVVLGWPLNTAYCRIAGRCTHNDFMALLHKRWPFCKQILLTKLSVCFSQLEDRRRHDATTTSSTLLLREESPTYTIIHMVSRELFPHKIPPTWDFPFKKERSCSFGLHVWTINFFGCFNCSPKLFTIHHVFLFFYSL